MVSIPTRPVQVVGDAVTREVDTVADLYTVYATSPGDDFVTTLIGYHSIDDGGGQQLYYDTGSSATVDGGFVFPGVGGDDPSDNANWTGTTFSGNAGTGRWLAVETDVINVRRWGAQTSDAYTVDSWRSFQIAVDYAMENQQAIKIPAGRYSVSEPVVIDCDTATYNNLIVIGDGPDQTFIKPTAGFVGSSVLKESGTTRLEHSRFQGMRVDCLNGGTRANYGFEFDIVAHTTFDQVAIQNAALTGGYFRQGFTNSFKNCSAMAGLKHGWYFGGPSRYWNQNSCENLSAYQNAGFGICLMNGLANTFVGGGCEYNQQGGLYVNNSRGGKIYGMYFEVNADIGLTWTGQKNVNSDVWYTGSSEVIKADIVFNSSDESLDEGTMAVPVEAQNATDGTRGWTVDTSCVQRDGSSNRHIFWAGCEDMRCGVITGDDTAYPLHFFFASHYLNQSIDLGKVSRFDGDEIDAIEFFDIDRANVSNPGLRTLYLDSRTTRSLGTPLLEIDLSSAASIESGSGAAGTLAATSHSVDGRTVYAISGSQNSDYYGVNIPAGRYASLSGKPCLLVAEWYQSTNYDDSYASKYNARLVLSAEGLKDATGIGNQSSQIAETTGNTVSTSKSVSTIGSSDGFLAGSLVSVQGAGTGGIAHVSRVTSMSSSLLVLADAAGSSTTGAQVRALSKQFSVRAFTWPSNGGSPSSSQKIHFGAAKSFAAAGKEDEPLLLSRLYVVPVGVKDVPVVSYPSAEWVPGTVTIYTGTSKTEYTPADQTPADYHAAAVTAFAAVANGDTIVLDDAEYESQDGNPITLTGKSRVTIKGGRFTRAAAQDYSGMLDLVNCTDCKIIGVTFDGEGGLTAPTANPATHDNTNGNTLRNATMIDLSGCEGILIHGCDFYDHVGSEEFFTASGKEDWPIYYDANALRILTSSHVIVDECRFVDIGNVGIQDDGTFTHVKNSSFKNCLNQGITSHSNSGSTIYEGCTFYRPTQTVLGYVGGINVNPVVASGMIENLVVADCHLEMDYDNNGSANSQLQTHQPFKFQGVRNLSIRGCTLKHGNNTDQTNGRASVALQDQVDHVTISDSYFSGGMRHLTRVNEPNVRIKNSVINADCEMNYPLMGNWNDISTDGCEISYELAAFLSPDASALTGSLRSTNTTFKPTGTTTQVTKASYIAGIEHRVEFGQSNAIEVSGVKYVHGTGNHGKSDTDVTRLVMSTVEGDPLTKLVDGTLTGSQSHPSFEASGDFEPTSYVGVQGQRIRNVAYSKPAGSPASYVDIVEWVWSASNGGEWVSQT